MSNSQSDKVQTGKYDDRHDELTKLTKDAKELTGLFYDVNLLVNDQGLVLDRIDYNVEHAKDNVQVGVENVVEADKFLRNYRKTMCCLSIAFIVVILALAAFIIVYAIYFVK